MKTELTTEELPLSPEEKQLLRKRAFATVVIAVLMTAVTGYFAYTIFSTLSGGMLIAAIVFFLFFFGILGLILFIRIRSAGETTKTVYTGIVQEKKTEAMQMRGSAPNERYLALVGDKWFTVEQEFYEQLHAGETVKLHTIRNAQIFKVERVDQHTIHVHQEHMQSQHQRSFYTAGTSFENLNTADRALLRRALIRSFLFRFLIGGIAAYLLFSAILVAFVLLYDFGSGSLSLVYWLDFVFVITGFILANIRTIRLIADMQAGIKIITHEKLIDKVSSNVLKPGPRSAISTKRYGSSMPQYFYFQTAKRWIRVSEEEFSKHEGGQTIPVALSKHSKTVLTN